MGLFFTLIRSYSSGNVGPRLWKYPGPANKAVTAQPLTVKQHKTISVKLSREWAYTDKRGVYAESDRIESLFKSAKPFNAWPPQTQAIIMEQLKAEHRDRHVDDFVYAFGTFKESEFGASYWESWALEYIDVYYYKKYKYTETSETMHDHYIKVKKLMRLIKQNGFDYTQPLMINCLPAWMDRPSKFWQSGGHHRLQAIRNLIKAGELQKSFRFPVLCCFEKREWDLETNMEQYQRHKQLNLEELF